MTTQKLSSEKLLDGALWRNMTRRRLSHILVAFLAGFFTLAVPLMMALPEILDEGQGLYAHPWEVLVRDTADVVLACMSVNAFIAVALGIYFGVITLGYMMKRRSAHFYHALPQKRETLYTTSVASALFCAAVGSLLAVAIALAELGVYGFFVSEVLTVFFRSLCKNVLFFLGVYAVAVFVGSFSGTQLVQVLMTGMFLFWPIATYCGMVLLPSQYMSYMDADYYLSAAVCKWLSPLLYAAMEYTSPLAPLKIIFGLFVAVVLLLGAVQIYRHRKMENAEQTIVFPKLGRVLMYMLLFTTTLYAGLFFMAMSGRGWVVFGFICGALLGFMLYNTILAKTPKAMFKGVKGLAVFAAAFALYFVLFGMDTFHTDKKVYTPRSAEISVSGINLPQKKYTDPALLQALTELLEEQVEQDGAFRSAKEARFGFWMRVVLHTKLGFPVARSYWICVDSDARAEFLRLFADDPSVDESIRYIQTYFGQYEGKQVSCEASGTYASEYYSGNIVNLPEFLDIYFAELGTANYDRLSQPSIGSINLYSFYVDNTFITYRLASDLYEHTSEYPLYVDMTDTIAYLRTHLYDRNPMLDGEAATVEYGVNGEELLYKEKSYVSFENPFLYINPLTYRADEVMGGELCDLRILADDGDCMRYTLTEEEAKEAWRLYLRTCGESTYSRVFVPWETEYYARVTMRGASDTPGEYEWAYVDVDIPKTMSPDFVQNYMH